jgi:hypothetical protein
MITRSAPPRAAAKWIAITAAVVALGCTSSGGFPLPPPDWSTPLPTGVDSDPNAFRARLDKGYPRSGTSHRRARAATCRPGLAASGLPRALCSVEVMIEPVGDTRLIDPNNAPAAGVAVARIENLDSVDREAKFGFRPGIQAVYYLWVDRKPGSTKARWTVLEVPMGAGIVKAGYQKDLKLCNYWHEGEIRVSDADFYEYKYDDHPCEVLASTQKSSVHQASFFSTEQFAALVERVAALLRGELAAAQGGWISCSGGCCT